MRSPTNPVILDTIKEVLTINEKVIKTILAIIILGATASICLGHWGTRAEARAVAAAPTAVIASQKRATTGTPSQLSF
ncbi:hypothetical protein [Levilactobacillus sp. HBUAS70063]|uniref:hypothetical protein n=1 Tax=Levilactobacillus sp. HBUAS70063 TaxID=3109359 RepID=UPI00313326D6